MISITDAFCVMNSFKTFADVICGYPLSHISSNNSYINTKFARMLFSFTFPKYDYGNKIPRKTDAKRRERERERERERDERVNVSQLYFLVFFFFFND